MKEFRKFSIDPADDQCPVESLTWQSMEGALIVAGTRNKTFRCDAPGIAEWLADLSPSGADQMFDGWIARDYDDDKNFGGIMLKFQEDENLHSCEECQHRLHWMLPFPVSLDVTAASLMLERWLAIPWDSEWSPAEECVGAVASCIPIILKQRPEIEGHKFEAFGIGVYRILETKNAIHN